VGWERHFERGSKTACLMEVIIMEEGVLMIYPQSTVEENVTCVCSVKGNNSAMTLQNAKTSD
jgi:hypothetical protein